MTESHWAAERAAERAKQRFASAQSDARYAERLGLGVSASAGFLVAVGRAPLVLAALVIFAAFLIAGVSRRRADRLERAMWIAQTRAALVAALAEQAATEKDESRVIDLREGVRALENFSGRR